MGADSERALFEVHGLQREALHLLHFFVFGNLTLVVIDLFFFFLDLIGELDAAQLLVLVDLFFVLFDLAIHLFDFRVQGLHLLLEKAQPVLLRGLDVRFGGGGFVLFGDDVGEALGESLDLSPQLFVLMLVLEQHFLEA